ncbi:hypothetical protein L484_010859 [Morus notabilis]|uniref:Uncharacterized protein n=1 Tax=Morus notabilis TaxID=981085 RepID=W9SC48_9ROSA|nr:hypothetical protein L484_010859 [Morus notabilis]
MGWLHSRRTCVHEADLIQQSGRSSKQCWDEEVSADDYRDSNEGGPFSLFRMVVMQGRWRRSQRLLAEFYARCSKIMNMVEALAEASGP